MSRLAESGARKKKSNVHPYGRAGYPVKTNTVLPERVPVSCEYLES